MPRFGGSIVIFPDSPYSILATAATFIADSRRTDVRWIGSLAAYALL